MKIRALRDYSPQNNPRGDCQAHLCSGGSRHWVAMDSDLHGPFLGLTLTVQVCDFHRKKMFARKVPNFAAADSPTVTVGFDLINDPLSTVWLLFSADWAETCADALILLESLS